MYHVCISPFPVYLGISFSWAPPGPVCRWYQSSVVSRSTPSDPSTPPPQSPSSDSRLSVTGTVPWLSQGRGERNVVDIVIDELISDWLVDTWSYDKSYLNLCSILHVVSPHDKWSYYDIILCIVYIIVMIMSCQSLSPFVLHYTCNVFSYFSKIVYIIIMQADSCTIHNMIILLPSKAPF